MASKIGMASNALVLLGDSPISSLDESGAGAQALANLYDLTYEDALTSHPWRFARKRLTLSKKTTGPLFGYNNAYALPADCLRVIELESGQDYEIHGEELHTHDDSAQLMYIYKVDEGDIPPYFAKYMEYRLASECCVAVTDRVSLAESMNAKAEQQWLRATGIDSQENTTVAIQDNPFIDVRG